MPSVYVRQHHIAKHLVIIRDWQLDITLLVLTVLSDLDSMFIAFISHHVEQQWPCVRSVIEGKYRINSKIENNMHLGSKLILSLIF